MSITINTQAGIHRTALLGASFLMGVAALTACGEGGGDVATISARTPAVAYVSPEQADREALLTVQAEHASGGLDQRAVPSTSAWTSAEDFEQSGVDSPSAQASVDALERLTFKDDR